MPLPKLIVITGPTASGKTALAEKLSLKFNGEIVSVDSRQIYKEMNIGTNKEILLVPQYLIDIVSSNEDFTLWDYKNLALKSIAKIHQHDKTPFLVGGTSLYIYTITENWQIPKVPPQKSLRQKLEKKSTKELYEKLEKLDYEAARVTGLNKRRLVRALEVILTTGKTFSSQRKKGKTLFNTLVIGIKIEQETLSKKIELRTEKMIKAGLEKEISYLAKKYSWDIPAMSAINYKEWKEYFAGKINKKELIELLNRNNRRYARQQMKWLKRDKNIKWISDYQESEKLVKDFLSH